MHRLFFVVSIILASLAMPYVTNAQTLGQDGQLKAGDEPLYSEIDINCLDVKMKLTKVYEQDGLNRVNAGQIYDTMSHKMMARLNSKVVEDRLDGGDLVKKTANFEDLLVKFRSEYQNYEVAMNRLLKFDCQARQHAFYSALEDVRTKRKLVNDSVANLNQASKDYYDSFLSFKNDFVNKNKANNNDN